MKTQNVPPTYLMPFISFLERHGYKISAPSSTHIGKNVAIQLAIDHFRDSQENIGFDVGTVSDGYHTFNELYEHRIMLFIALCSLTDTSFKDHGMPSMVWRSRIHSDGSEWAGWFIMGIGDIKGKQITYHLPDSKWDLTEFAQTRMIAPEYDGHTSADVLERLQKHFL